MEPTQPPIPLLEAASPQRPMMHPRARRLSSTAPASPATAHQPEFNTNHVFEVKNGQASVCVNDTLEIRSAFLKYCNSIVRPTEMHRVAGPWMPAPNFISMCKDLDLVEPQGPISLMVVGFTYNTLKSDEAEGLSYAQFLDALMELAFESGRNIAGHLQSLFAHRPVPPQRPAALTRSDLSMRARASEPGFAPQEPTRILTSEATSGPQALLSPDGRGLQPRLSESGGRFQRSSLLRSVDSCSILGAAAAQTQRSLSGPADEHEAMKSPRPPSGGSGSMRASVNSSVAPARPFLRPSAAQRPLKARGFISADNVVSQDDGAAHEVGLSHSHPLHSSVMNSWSSGKSSPAAGASRSPLSRISAMFQAPGAEEEEPEAMFGSSTSSQNIQSAYSGTLGMADNAFAAPQPRPPSASSPLARAGGPGSRPSSGSLLVRPSSGTLQS